MIIHSPYRPQDSAIRRFLKHYGLASLEEMHAKISDLLGSEYGLRVLSFDTFKPSICMRITTDRGPLYYKSFDPDLNSIDDLMNLADYLRGRGIPLPWVVPTRRGRRNGFFQGRPAYLCEVAEGVAISPEDEEHVVLSARALAAFHRAGSDYQTRTNGEKEYVWRRISIAGEIEQNLPKYWQWIMANKITEEPSLAICAKARRILEGTAGSTAIPPLPKACIHGDYKPCHVYCRNGDLSAIIDFDFAGHAERMRDLFSMISGVDHGSEGCLRLERQRRFVEEYQKEMPLTAEEEAVLPTIFLWANFSRVAILCEWHNRGLDVGDDLVSCALEDLEFLCE